AGRCACCAAEVSANGTAASRMTSAGARERRWRVMCLLLSLRDDVCGKAARIVASGPVKPKSSCFASTRRVEALLQCRDRPADVPNTSGCTPDTTRRLPVARRVFHLPAHVALVAAALLFAGALAPAARAQGSRPAAKLDGLWDATIQTQTAAIPFRFEIHTKGTAATGSFFEGDRKVDSSEGTFSAGKLKLVWDHLNTTLELTQNGDRLTGAYVNNRPNARPQTVEMRRFTPVTTDAADVPQATGTWEMRRLAAEVSA